MFFHIMKFECLSERQGFNIEFELGYLILKYFDTNKT